MSNHIRLRKGLNIPLKGEAQPKITKTISPGIVAVKPTDFKAFNPRLLIKEGEEVKAGTPLLADKKRADIKLCSPVSGKVKEIVRGDKRKLLAVTIEATDTNEYQSNEIPPLHSASKEQIVQALAQNGLWAAIKQRPYGTIPDLDSKPKAIFVSGFDSAPLAPDYEFTLKGEIANIQLGIEVLGKLTAGGVHISLHASKYAGSPLHRVEKAIIHTFDGPHPAGNVGVQIHHISPVNKGETVWTIDMYSLVAIGKLFSKGIFDLERLVAITGPRAQNPSYVKAVPGICMSQLKEYVNKESKEDLAVRYVSGNALTGDNVSESGHLGFFHNQVTLLSEGKYHELFGWIKPMRLKKFSLSRSYFSWLFPKKKYALDTNLNGGERALVMTGVYEKVTPMDIYPMHLIKAILAGDIDKMEALGIYEVIEEDLALCEFVCPSKTEIQEIVSQGIDLMIKEMS
ncbi:MAG: Na(+)-translocating NADH-quinone reductase subunit A [Bacteroidia bacterium]|jgi:Na+-transporting NADH:ubiquinone oxidoreductase subunit A|nr:Na(+)-translocating NADH-quinone reductase subunit A [Bacteroidales bacterium]MDD3300702.1 Na(+)-translocating NADH-quinone reductase subunit A [Bacteroidales bacterium]MDD3844552.1 Na(+)-translocating NADH-quinone reductase subunit A [Bacteroidales bacterium]MDD4618720.1 Na(+)-translocating NADH-quinone reductase subunit A [Bacteroidales bacterium]NCC46362.1 Na(+)-translocating NADH-quinone reductase subunit A [Bacteroidia bacterium]